LGDMRLDDALALLQLALVPNPLRESLLYVRRGCGRAACRFIARFGLLGRGTGSIHRGDHRQGRAGQTHSNNGLTEALEETCGTIPGNARAAATLNATALRCDTLTALAGSRPAVGAFRIGAVLRSGRFQGLRRRSRFFAVVRALTPVQPQLVSPFERGPPVTRPDVRIDWNPDHAVRLASIVFHRCSFRHKPLWCLHFRPHKGASSVPPVRGLGVRGSATPSPPVSERVAPEPGVRA